MEFFAIKDERHCIVNKLIIESRKKYLYKNYMSKHMGFLLVFIHNPFTLSQTCRIYKILHKYSLF